VIFLRLVNENATPTTLHNFALMVESEGKKWFAQYPEEPIPKRKNVWTPPEIEERERRLTNLVTYLDDAAKIAGHGVGIDGYVVFRLPGFGVDSSGKSETLPEEGVDMFLTVFVEDAFGVNHPIKDQWGRKPRPFAETSMVGEN
jgi:hypothetical protein